MSRTDAVHEMRAIHTRASDLTARLLSTKQVHERNGLQRQLTELHGRYERLLQYIDGRRTAP